MDTAVSRAVIQVLAEALALGDRGNALTVQSPLLGAVPEFDSMAVLTVITRLEEAFGIRIADDEISAETFETVASVIAYVESKRE